MGDGAALLRITRDSEGEMELSKIDVPKTPNLEDSIRRIEGERYRASDWPGYGLKKSAYDAISAAGPKDVWITIAGGGSAHFNGTSWRLEKASGTALMHDERGRTWMAGGGDQGAKAAPVIFEKRGGEVVSESGPALPNAGRIGALARQGDQVWAAGNSGALLVSKAGGPFVAVEPPDDKREDFKALWLDPKGTAGFLLGTNVYRKVGERFEEKLELPGGANDLWSASGGHSVWAVGFWPYRLQNGKFSRVPIEGYRAGDDLTLGLFEDRFEAVDGIASNDVWMVGAFGGVFRFDGTALKEVFPRETEAHLVGLEWTGERAWTAATRDGKMLSGTLDTDRISAEASPLEDAETFQKLLSGDFVMAWCSKVRVRVGATWKELPAAPSCVKRVAGVGPDDFWAMGGGLLEEKHVWRFKKGKWRAVPTGVDARLYDVAVAADGTAFIGGDGVLFRLAGGGLEIVARDAQARFRAVAIKSATDVWIGGGSDDFDGGVFHWDGKRLERFPKAAASTLSSIAFDAAGNLWAVGIDGVAARYDGKTFVPLATGTRERLEHLLIHPSGVMLVAGEGGTLLRRDPPKP